MKKFKINWDAIGITTSIACAIHCAVLPLLLTSLPLFGINLLDNLFFEYGMILLAFMIAFISLRHGHRRHHRGRMPVLFLISGFLFLLAKQIWHQYELRLLPFAVILIVSAHLLNIRYCKFSHDPDLSPATSHKSA